MTCGWCLTDNCEQCIKEIKYYEKTWQCKCKKCTTQTETEQEN